MEYSLSLLINLNNISFPTACCCYGSLDTNEMLTLTNPADNCGFLFAYCPY